ncbi:hypothetical protein PGAL8A_00272500 [Plasmodium gallinaceum]|uniref:Uncharacterized protein n=1 Tax=Plasmodium gallinaceum TaxID=5849 RepID=A0A1J1GSM3_PLAGA|nr:hypothetical protein PGAL8A_00272500 [Plasmodium gallinaceum]CRG95525.1 hypothetical protein PGAL8A_00272500 [Plasmodium gallinaceum]
MRQLLTTINTTIASYTSANFNVSESNNNNNNNSNSVDSIYLVILALILSIKLFFMFYTIIYTYRRRGRAIYDDLMLEVESVDSGYADIEYEDIDEEIDERARILDVDDRAERTVNERVTLNVYGQINSEEDEVEVRIY